MTRRASAALALALLAAPAAHADGYRVWYAHPGSDWSAGTFTYPSESDAAVSADAFRRDGYAVAVLPDGYRPASPPRPAPRAAPRAKPSQTQGLPPRPPQAPPAWAAALAPVAYPVPAYYAPPAYYPQPAYYAPAYRPQPAFRAGPVFFGGACVSSR